jgi:hypothetical protein
MLAAQTEKERGSLRTLYLNSAVRDRAGGARSTGVRWWLKFCIFGRSTSPLTRLTAASPLEAKLEAEQLLMDFAIWLATCRPSGKPVSAKSIGKYISEVRAWHLRTTRTHLTGDLDYSAIQGLIRGLARELPQPAKQRRWGVRTQDLARAIRSHLSAPTASASMWAAMLSTAFCGLLRAAEAAVQEGEAFDPLVNLTREDISFKVDEKGNEYMVLMVRPAKQYPGALKDVPLLISAGGSLLDPVRAMKRMLELDPVPVHERASTPLFRLGQAAITVAQVRSMVKVLMRAIGLDERRYGAHSLRIGGATAALAAGLSPATIRAAGRWSSDIYLIYCRISKESAAGVATCIGSTPFEDLERGAQFIGEELVLAAWEAPRAVELFVEKSMIDDLCDEDIM